MIFRFAAFVFSFFFFFVAGAQEQGNDSLDATSDSIIRALRSLVHEEQMKNMILMEQLARSDEEQIVSERQLAERKARIDSLRAITQGVPLVVDEDTLFVLYARRGGLLPEARVEAAKEKIEELGKSLSFFADSIYVYESEYTTDIMASEEVLLSLSDLDGLWQNMSRQELAEMYRKIIQTKVQELHEDYGLQQKLWGLLLVVVVVVVQVLLIKATNWAYRKRRMGWIRKLMKLLKPLNIKGYELLDAHRMGILLVIAFKVLRIVVIVMQLFVSIPLLISAFPETKTFTYTLFNYVWNPVTDIFYAVVGFLPNFFKIIVIVLCFRYLVKGLRYLSNEIANGNLKINGFYPDWADPTFYILRILCYSFMLVMIWPLLPSSNSEVFQGVSVFIGVIVSLGSTAIVGNVMAGLVMTYMRPFHIGDFIKYGEIEGYVIEKTILVTRIRTRKNDVITIPNSNLMGSQTSNYTAAAQNYGIVVHTKVTIGYDEPWEKIRDLLLAAAEATPHIKKNPKPFVIVTSLEDFYVEYEINAYTTSYETLPVVYSALHQNILDNFHHAGVEIMSPHIYAHRMDLPPQIPEGQTPS